jgi:hypothetical protein
MIGGAMALAYVDRHSLRAGLTGWDFSDVFADVVILAVPAVGFLLASRRPANRIGWLFLAAGLAVGLSHFSKEYGLRALVAAPASLPAGRVFGWLSNWTWTTHYALLAFVFLLFPTGQLRSRRWRLASWFVAGAFALNTAVQLVIATGFWSDPYQAVNRASVSKVEDPRLLFVAFVLIVAAMVVSVAAVIVRFARCSGTWLCCSCGSASVSRS